MCRRCGTTASVLLVIVFVRRWCLAAVAAGRAFGQEAVAVRDAVVVRAVDKVERGHDVASRQYVAHCSTVSTTRHVPPRTRTNVAANVVPALRACTSTSSGLRTRATAT